MASADGLSAPFSRALSKVPAASSLVRACAMLQRCRVVPAAILSQQIACVAAAAEPLRALPDLCMATCDVCIIFALQLRSEDCCFKLTFEFLTLHSLPSLLPCNAEGTLFKCAISHHGSICGKAVAQKHICSCLRCRRRRKSFARACRSQLSAAPAHRGSAGAAPAPCSLPNSAA